MSFQDRLRGWSLSVPWNLVLLTVGAVIMAFGIKAVARPQGFVSGGVTGTAMLIVYAANLGTISFWYAVLSIPIMFLGWFFLSRRFMFYTIYCTLITILAVEFIPWRVPINNPLLAAVVAGLSLGAGSGVAMRSLGSGGGLDVVSLILNARFNMNVGSVSIFYNAVMFLVALPLIGLDNVLYSMVVVYFSATAMSFFADLFNDRKMAIIISEKHNDIAAAIFKRLKRGCTVLHGQGAYTKKEREVLLVVVHNHQVRRLEELVFLEDPTAFLVIENTSQVLGKGFSQRKTY